MQCAHTSAEPRLHLYLSILCVYVFCSETHLCCFSQANLSGHQWSRMLFITFIILSLSHLSPAFLLSLTPSDLIFQLLFTTSTCSDCLLSQSLIHPSVCTCQLSISPFFSCSHPAHHSIFPSFWLFLFLSSMPHPLLFLSAFLLFFSITVYTFSKFCSQIQLIFRMEIFQP